MIREVSTTIKKLFARFTLISMGIAVLMITFAVAMVTFIFFARMIFKNDQSGFDVRASEFLSGFVSEVNTNVMALFTFLGSHVFLIPANLLLLAYFFFLKKHRWYSITIPVVALSSLLLMLSLKSIFHRDRPLSPLLEAAQGYSFPSGHALVSFTFYGLLIYLTWVNIKNRWLKWILTVVLALLIISIGLSRVYLRVHYASDVIAGYSLGCMWLLLSLWILRKIERYSLKKGDVAIEIRPGN